jgi:Putative Actinobacterial Holin-X, holin superfamily III
MSEHALPAEARPIEPDKSIGDLFGDLSQDLGDLVSMHIDLAKAELKHDIQQAGKTAGFFGAGAFAGYMTIVLLSLTLAWVLATWLPTWAGFLIVAVAWGLATAVLLANGKRKADALDLAPHETVETVKEDVEWAKHQRS